MRQRETNVTGKPVIHFIVKKAFLFISLYHNTSSIIPFC